MKFKVIDYKCLFNHDDYRWDSEYLCNEPYKNPSLNYCEIGKMLEFTQYGISIEMNDEGRGTKIYRMNEITNMMCDRDVLKYAELTEDEVDEFTLKDRDVLFNRTNSQKFVGRTGLFRNFGDEPFVFASYLIRIKPIEEKIKPEYLVVFLNTKYGIEDIKRRARISINQSNVNAEELKRIQIPLIEDVFQEKIVNFFDLAFDLIKKSELEFKSVQTLILKELELTNWKPTNKLTFIKKFSDVNTAKRFDAEYFQPKYDEIDKKIEKYSHGFKLFDDFVEKYSKGKLLNLIDEPTENSKPYILIDNVRGNEYQYFTEATKGTLCGKNDILIVGDGSKSGEVGTDLEGYVGSTLINIKIKKDSKLNKYTLLALLKFYFSKLNDLKTGSGVPHLDLRILPKLKIPLIKSSIQVKIDSHIINYKLYKKKSEDVLRILRTVVEKIVEESENQAEKWLDKKLIKTNE